MGRTPTGNELALSLRIFNGVDQRTLPEKPYGTTASKNNPSGRKKRKPFINACLPLFGHSLVKILPHGIVNFYNFKIV